MPVIENVTETLGIKKVTDRPLRIGERRQQETLFSDVEVLASSDRLTQLANRHPFQVYLEQEWLRMAREQAPLSLILCDIDGCNNDHDICDNPTNNRFWQHVVQVIAAAVKRPADLVARYGSGRFAVILSNTQAEEAVCLAEEIRSQIKAIEIDSAHCQFSQSLTASLGVASMIPSRDYSPTLLLTTAAQALYQAKLQGCDRVILYETLLRQTQFAR